MSNAILPITDGYGITAIKTPQWKTRRAQAVSGFERRVQQRIYPMWSVEMSIEVLRDVAGLDEAKNLIGFFNARAGMFDSFLYSDPDDNSVTDQQFAVLDGSATQFQLTRPFGGFVEPVHNVNVLSAIKSDGVALVSPADYSISATGRVTLTAAGTVGHVLTWSGTYYWRVIFDADRLPVRKVLQGLWDLKKLPLYGSVQNKV